MGKTLVNDIANELSLSRNTVSKVLNGRYVPEKTRKAVLEKARQMNYKQLSNTSKKYKLLLLSGKPVTNFNFFLPIINELENLCYKEGHQFFQYACKPSKDSENFLKSYIINAQIDGIICIETFENEFIKKNLKLEKPVIFLDSPVNDNDIYNFDIVIQDNFTPIINTLNYLIKNGVKKIGFVGDIKHCLSFKERYEAMLIAISNNELQHTKKQDFIFDDESLIYQNITEFSEAIKTQNDICNAYVCANDFIARQFIEAMKRDGLQCPKDFKVIGYDNTNEARLTNPTLTTVFVNHKNLSRIIFDNIILKIENPNRYKAKIIAQSELVTGESTTII